MCCFFFMSRLRRLSELESRLCPLFNVFTFYTLLRSNVYKNDLLVIMSFSFFIANTKRKLVQKTARVLFART